MPNASEGNKKSKKNGQKNIYTMSKVNFFLHPTTKLKKNLY